MGHGHLAGLSRSGLAGLAVASSDHSRGLPLTMLHAYRLHSALLERGGRGGGGRLPGQLTITSLQTAVLLTFRPTHPERHANLVQPEVSKLCIPPGYLCMLATSSGKIKANSAPVKMLVLLSAHVGWTACTSQLSCQLTHSFLDWWAVLSKGSSASPIRCVLRYFCRAFAAQGWSRT